MSSELNIVNFIPLPSIWKQHLKLNTQYLSRPCLGETGV